MLPYNSNTDLMRYLPSYYHENIDMKRLMDAETPEIDGLWADVEAVRDNQFIATADDRRIRQWERLLRIQPDHAAQSLAERKTIVLLRLATRMPLTRRWLDEKLTEIVGDGNYGILLDGNTYRLMVLLHDDTRISQAIRAYLREKVPANLLLGYRIVIPVFELEIGNKPWFRLADFRARLPNEARVVPGVLCRVVLSPFNAVPVYYNGAYLYDGSIDYSGYVQKAPYAFPARWIFGASLARRHQAEQAVTVKTWLQNPKGILAAKSAARARLNSNVSHSAHLTTVGNVCYDGTFCYDGTALYDGQTAQYEL